MFLSLQDAAQDLVAGRERHGERLDHVRLGGGVSLHPHNHPLPDLPTRGHVNREILRFW